MADTPRAMNRALLILDLDETLVYARREHDGLGYAFETPPYFVSVRPHLPGFLDSVFEWFTVAVWTSAGEDYGREVISRIFPDPAELAFCWFVDRCTRHFDPALSRSRSMGGIFSSRGQADEVLTRAGWGWTSTGWMQQPREG